MAIPVLSHIRIEKRSKGYAVICGDPRDCPRPLFYLFSSGARLTSAHEKDVHVSPISAEDFRRLADFIDELKAEGDIIQDEQAA